MEHILQGLDAVLNFKCIMIIAAGVLYGIIIGALPGLGTILGIIILLPVTYSMEMVPSVALVLAVYCSAMYGGSIAAVLINTPGTPAAAATGMDGYPMTVRGKSDYALGWVTLSSIFGGLFSTCVLLLAAPQIASVALKFGPVETFALICLAMTCIITVSQGSVVKGISSGIIGLFLATVGGDPITGDMRFDFGYFPLTGGINLIAVLMGMFALSEVFVQAAHIKKGQDKTQIKAKSGMRIAPLSEWLKRKVTLIKAAVIGTFIGALPGTGSSLAVFVSYAEAKRAGAFREKLGTGEPEGLIASETANNAVCGGALIPTLALGIPGDAEAAVIMSALIIQGVQPGVRLLVDNPDIIYTAFISLAVINICMLFIAYLTSFAWTKVLSVPRSVLFSLVTIFALVGSYGVRGNPFDMLVALFAGILGFFMKRGGYSVIPLVIGLVLGPMFELSMRQSLIITDGNFIKLLVGHPIAVFIFVLVFFFLFGPFFLAWRTKRKDELSVGK